MSTNRRTHHHHHLWDVVATLVLIFEAASCSSIEFYEPSGLEIEDYSPQFLTYVDQVIQDLVQNAFWTEGQWYNMTLRPDKLFGLLYDKPKTQTDTTDPTGVYGKQKRSSSQELPFIYQSAPPPVPCNNAASTSIISGAKAVDFASFAIGIMTLVININNNINNNNNNNNNINFNSVDSSNIVANFNTNNANQVNIMPGAGRKKRSAIGSAAVALFAAIKVAMESAMRDNTKPADAQIPEIHLDYRNDSTVSKIQKIVINKMLSDPKSKIMAGCSDMQNCQRRLSLFI